MKRDEWIAVFRRKVEEALDAAAREVVAPAFNKPEDGITCMGWIPKDRERIDRFVTAQALSTAVRYRITLED